MVHLLFRVIQLSNSTDVLLLDLFPKLKDCVFDSDAQELVVLLENCEAFGCVFLPYFSHSLDLLLQLFEVLSLFLFGELFLDLMHLCQSLQENLVNLEMSADKFPHDFVL